MDGRDPARAAAHEPAHEAEHEPAHEPKRRWNWGTHRGRWGAFGVAVVLAFAGLLLVVAAQQARVTGSRQPEDLVQLVRQRSDRVAHLTSQITDLQDRQEKLIAAQPAVAQLPEPAATAQGVVTGRVAVSGPGVSVSLQDAPTGGELPDGAVPDDLVVHQQDVEAVINALWAGGAEAMTIQGQRVTPLTAVRCVGNVLLLRGQVYSPPYVIAAIGDPERLQESLDADRAIQVYKEYVRAYGLGWNVTEQDVIEMPSATDSLKEAEIPAGTDPYALP